MKQMINWGLSVLSIAFTGVLFYFFSIDQNFSADPDPFLDRELADKYNLQILPPLDKNEELDSAPEWYQKLDMSASDRGSWSGYQFILKDTLINRKVRIRNTHGFKEVTEHYPVEKFDSLDYSRIEGVFLLSHVPHSKKAFKTAQEKGVKAIPYLHFTDIHSNYADQDVFIFQHPEILAKDGDGRWMHMPMDGSFRLHRFLTCANSPSYWKLSLAYVEKIMEWGADGIFIDNAGEREACMAHRFNHIRNPEFDDMYIEHKHLFPDATHDYAWGRMLQAIRSLVKSYGEEKIVVLNPGIDTPVQNYGDAGMWESFIFSWAWGGRLHTWEDVKSRAKDHQEYLDSGRRIEAMSYISSQNEDAKNDAFWAFSSARLVDFIWKANIYGTGAEILYQAHMGEALGRFIEEEDEIVYRMFENGLIVLNNSASQTEIELALPAGWHGDHLVDLYNNSEVVGTDNNSVHLTIPEESAKVFMKP